MSALIVARRIESIRNLRPHSMKHCGINIPIDAVIRLFNSSVLRIGDLQTMFFKYQYKKKYKGVLSRDLGGYGIGFSLSIHHQRSFFIISILQCDDVPFTLCMCCKFKFDKPCYNLRLFLF
ncbi:hypothetical protein TNCV_1013061 [Trichonephila clavipes]|uniref:Uncharacterized protein n=1 Tax=Trichonephila clavipes TaxID=2585209 RepID=A0A8X7BB44_TRICX|nr:hypothetical protein TNCV_1013061 [Trichonephila clavipes]